MQLNEHYKESQLRDVFSLIKWNYNLDELKSDDEVLVIVKDDSSDYINYYITSAWRPYGSSRFYKDNDYISTIIAWAEMPKYENLKIFE